MADLKKSSPLARAAAGAAVGLAMMAGSSAKAQDNGSADSSVWVDQIDAKGRFELSCKADISDATNFFSNGDRATFKVNEYMVEVAQQSMTDVPGYGPENVITAATSFKTETGYRAGSTTITTDHEQIELNGLDEQKTRASLVATGKLLVGQCQHILDVADAHTLGIGGTYHDSEEGTIKVTRGRPQQTIGNKPPSP